MQTSKKLVLDHRTFDHQQIVERHVPELERRVLWWIHCRLKHNMRDGAFSDRSTRCSKIFFLMEQIWKWWWIKKSKLFFSFTWSRRHWSSLFVKVQNHRILFLHVRQFDFGHEKNSKNHSVSTFVLNRWKAKLFRISIPNFFFTSAWSDWFRSRLISFVRFFDRLKGKR